ncbi:MAG: PhoH family protein [Flavobacteriales bacterium]|nr:PhoH family protein [Flavobacteriales bacterium]MBT5354460.1 PhoH family protein [Flavobacteriales bacterium]MBT6815497.1 PhoH family protein [Flavobacteriales bacterium]MBT7620785.1 PhoH family protein [Flavobacteriales bacterium]
MNEIIIDLEKIDLVVLFGSNNRKLYKIREYFPDLKLVARGNKLKVIGNKDKILFFENKFQSFIDHIYQYNRLTINQIERLIMEDEKKVLENKDDVILHGTDGKLIKARTVNQRKIVSNIRKNDLLFAIGPAGTGKTYTAVALSVKALKSKEVKRIILTRPAVEAGENLGFLPGDLKEKLDPYMQPLYDALIDMLPSEKLKDYLEQGIIQIAPLAFMRGRTLDKAFVILDEAQNATESQMKMFLTRMGMSAKFVITGDETQIDLPSKQKSGLVQAKEKLEKIEGVSFVFLDEKDVIRHKLVKKIIKAYK